MIYPQWSIIPPRSTVHRTVMNRFIDTFICISNAWMKTGIKSSLRGVSKEESLFKEEHKNTRGNNYPSLSVYSSIPLYSMFLPVSYILRNIDMRMNERVLNRSIQYLHILLGINKDIFKESNVLTFDEYILWKSFIEVYSLMYI